MVASPKPDDVDSEIAHFSSIPWCAKHINEAGWTPVPTRSREPKSSTEDSFFSTALQTSGTLARHATICKAPSIPLPSSYRGVATEASGDAADANANADVDVSTTLTIPACRTFWQLGADVNGYPHTAHGGLLATLLDEQMGILLSINAEFGTAVAQQGSGSAQSLTDMTVYMNVRYKAPVKTPGVVMAVAECTKQQGRKTFIRAAVVDERGVECAIAEGMYIQVPATRL